MKWSKLSRNPLLSQAKLETNYGHEIHIPREAIMKSSETQNDSVRLIVSVLDQDIFKVSGIFCSMLSVFIFRFF